MPKRTYQQSMDELRLLLPRWNGDAETMGKALRKLEESKRIPWEDRGMFMLYWGLGKSEPWTYTRIAANYLWSRRTVVRRTEKVLHLLMDLDSWE